MEDVLATVALQAAELVAQAAGAEMDRPRLCKEYFNMAKPQDDQSESGRRLTRMTVTSKELFTEQTHVFRESGTLNTQGSLKSTSRA